MSRSKKNSDGIIDFILDLLELIIDIVTFK